MKVLYPFGPTPKSVNAQIRNRNNKISTHSPDSEANFDHEPALPTDQHCPESLCQQALQRQQATAAYPEDRLWDLFERLHCAWKDPEYPLRIEAQEKLPARTGFSSAMIRCGLDALPGILDPKALRQKLTTELGLQPAQTRHDASFTAATRSLRTWHPLGTIVHILAGNVFLSGVGSLVEGMITGNVNILKMARSEPIFMPLFLQSITDLDHEGVIAASIALITYDSDASATIKTFQQAVDGIVVTGGEAAVSAYRNNLPSRCRLITFGPKLSLSYLDLATQNSKNSDENTSFLTLSTQAQRLADDITMWDQYACTAPQACFIQGSIEAREGFVDALAVALAKKEDQLPAGNIDLDTAIEIQKLRSIYQVDEALGQGRLCTAKDNLDWTITVDASIANDDYNLVPSPLARTIRIIPVNDIDTVTTAIAKLRGAIQSVGLESAECYIEYATKLAHAGAVRIVPLGEMSGGEIDDPHDGGSDLPQFMHLQLTRLPHTSSDFYPIDHDAATLKRTVEQRLRQLMKRARTATHYAGFEAQTLKDLPTLPILNRPTMEAGLPPNGNALETKDGAIGGYVSRSGGSTGKSVFSIYNDEDWQHMINEAVRLFHALGLKKGDRLANFMMAGDLYGSFVSFDHINCRLGVQSFAFAHKQDPELLYEMWRDFNINAIQGVPTTLMPMLRSIKRAHSEFTIEKIIYAGSPMSAADRGWLMDTLGCKRVSSVIGANDGGQIAFQCQYLAGSHHHVIDDFNYIEIVDDDGQTVPTGSSGRILITSLLKFAYPLIRYDIGDRARFIPNNCPCGRHNRTIEYLGRNDDIIIVGLLNLRYRDICAALRTLETYQIQVAAGSDDHGERLIVRVECPQPDTAMKENIRKHLLDHVAKLDERLRNGSLAALDVEVFADGQLPRNPRTGKIKSLIDERI